MEIEGLKNICRLCMKDYDTSNLIEITKETEDLFYDLTQCLVNIKNIKIKFRVIHSISFS